MKDKILQKNFDIFFLSSYTYPQKYGGVEIYTYERALEVSSKNIPTTIVCGNSNGFKYKKKEQSDFFSIIFLPVINTNKLLFFITFLISCTIFFYKRKKPFKQIVIDSQFLGVATIVGFIISEAFKFKLVVTCHGTDILVLRRNFFLRLVQNVILINAYKIFVTSTKIKQLLETSFKQKKIIKVKLGIPPINDNMKEKIKTGKPYRKRYPKFLFLGRLDDNKNPLGAILIIIKLMDIYGKVSLHLIGDGYLRKEIIRILQLTNENKLIKLRGKIPHEEITNELFNYDFLINTSYSEGTPLSLLEAMACGIVCFTTPVGSIPDIIKNGHNGIFIHPKSTETSAEIINQVLRNQGLIEKLRTNGIITIKKQFDKEKLLYQYLKNLGE